MEIVKCRRCGKEFDRDKGEGLVLDYCSHTCRLRNKRLHWTKYDRIMFYKENFLDRKKVGE